MIKEKLKSKNEKTINRPMRTWQFWIIAFAVPLLAIDAFVQWFVVNNYLMSIASVVLVALYCAELRAQLQRHTTLIGQNFAVVLTFVLLAALVLEYLVS